MNCIYFQLGFGAKIQNVEIEFWRQKYRFVISQIIFWRENTKIWVQFWRFCELYIEEFILILARKFKMIFFSILKERRALESSFLSIMSV